MGRGRRNREYDEIVRDSGILGAKELHENKQARLAKKKLKLQAEIETVDAEMLADRADFAETVPQDLYFRNEKYPHKTFIPIFIRETREKTND